MAFGPEAYPVELKNKCLAYVQFDAHFVARAGRLPTIDGTIDRAEWQDAGYEVIHVGTAQAQVTEYG